MTLSRDAEELLFAAGLAEQERAYDGQAAERARLREEERQRALFREVERQRELERQSARLREEERRREQERVRQEAIARAEARFREEERRQAALERQRERDREQERRAHQQEVQLERERGEQQGLNRLEPGASGTRRALDAFEDEQRLKDRNRSLRNAFSVVPGGDEALATIEALVDADAGSRRRVAELPSVTRTLQRTFEADDDRQRKARIRAEAEKIPMGLEAFESFTRERELDARNAALRQAPAGETPRTLAQPSLLSPGAEARLWDDTLALEETKGGNRPSAYNALAQDARIWNDGLGQDAQASPRGRVSEYDRLKDVDRIWEDQLAIEEQAANPPEFRSDLLADLREMFAVAGLPFDPSAETWQGFVGEGVNGLTPEDRFFTIGSYGGYSDEQLERLLGGATVAEVGPPAGRWDNEVALSPADRNGALTFLQMREPETDERRGAVVDFASRAVSAFLDTQGEVAERRTELYDTARRAIAGGASWTSEAVESALSAEGERIRRENETYREVGETLKDFGGDRLDDVAEMAAKIKTFADMADEQTKRLLELTVEGGCLARERVHQALLGFVTYNPLESDIDETWPARMADGLSGKRTFDGENNRWYEVYPNDPWGRDRAMAEFSEWITDPVNIAAFVIPALRKLDPFAGQLMSQSIEAGCQAELE
ncbi:MAG: hypothetical protein O3A10_05345 [Chloroflexi bacterium]|nr:hypothetical protein [Chloroflexota bacterium]